MDKIPFSTVENLEQFFLFRLLSEEQKAQVLGQPTKIEQHRLFETLLIDSGYLPQPDRS